MGKKKITTTDLYNWMREKEEDPIVDGPFYLSTKQEKEFIRTLDKNIISWDENEFDFLGIGGGQFDNKQEEHLVLLW